MTLARIMCAQSGVGASVLKASPEQPVLAKTAETVYHLPGHGGSISTGLGQALLDRGFDVTGSETVVEFKSMGFRLK